MTLTHETNRHSIALDGARSHDRRPRAEEPCSTGSAILIQVDQPALALDGAVALVVPIERVQPAGAPTRGSYGGDGRSSLRGRSSTAGPCSTLPVMSKRDPWHGQSQLVSDGFHPTRQR